MFLIAEPSLWAFDIHSYPGIVLDTTVIIQSSTQLFAFFSSLLRELFVVETISNLLVIRQAHSRQSNTG